MVKSAPMTANITDNKIALSALRKQWLVFTGLCIAGVSGGFLLLRTYWANPASSAYAFRWLFQSDLVIIYLLVVLWKGLRYNHRLTETRLLPGLGPGNWMTLLRGALIAALAGFLFTPRLQGWPGWTPALLYLLAAAADFSDGYLARISDHATRLGEILDMSFDGLGVLVAASLAIQYGQVPVWYLSVALARYLFLAGLQVRKWRHLPVHELPPSVRRRAVAGAQMGFIAFILMPVFTPPAAHIAAVFFALPFLAGFGLDWLYTSGARRAVAGNLSSFSSTLSRWLPVLLRLLIAAFATGPLSQRFIHYDLQATFYAERGLPAAETSMILLGLLEALALVLLLLGAGGRVAAVLALLLLGVNQPFAGPTFGQIVLIVAYASILFMGTGAFSLWTPENRWIHRRAGEA
jgi:CDP-diacylglycerol--glycerol-3-phosphate 3-phosphatidyltransferase